MFRKRDAFAVYLLLEGGLSLCFTLVFTVNMIYQATVVGLNPLQLVLVGTLLETTAFVFELPTGIVADVVSRRLSILIGLLLLGAGFLLEGALALFGVVLASQVLCGLGYTFISGATQAWIADEVGEDRAGQAFLRGAQIGQIGALVGIPLSVGLARLTIRLPILTGGVLILGLALILSAIMPETGFHPASDRSSWGTFRAGVRLVRGRSLLVVFLGIAAVTGLYSEGVDRLWTPHMLDNFTFPVLGTVAWFGLIKALSMVLSVIGTEVMRRRVDLADQRRVARVLFGMNALMIASLLVFALAGRFGVALAAYLVFGLLRSVSEPLLDGWINPVIEPQVRATVFSMSAQVNAIGQIAGGPAVGLIGTWVSLRAALVTSAVILSPVLLLYVRAVELERDFA